MIINKYKEALEKLNSDHYENVYEPALTEILSYFEEKVENFLHDNKLNYSVLNVIPGHGKTTVFCKINV